MRSYIDELNNLYASKVFLKESTDLGPQGIGMAPGEYDEEENIAPVRKCLKCRLSAKECECDNEKAHSEDDMVFAKKEPHSGYDHEEDHEHHENNAYMAKQQLYRTVKMASMLHDIINDDEQLEAWMASKITQAFDDLNAIFGYKDYEHFREQLNRDMEIEEKTEQDLYKSIDDGGTSLINKIKEIMQGQPRERVEDAVYGMIKMLES
jgi:hypothetical protein